jgi:CAAX protease family protein
VAASRPLTMYFLIAFGIPWIAGIGIIGPVFVRGDPVGPGAAAFLFAMTSVVDGRAALRELAQRMLRARVGPWWYGMAGLLFPILVVCVLGALTLWISPRYAPGFLPLGVAVGLLAGLFEEIGWTGFALPRLLVRFGALRAALTLGALWSAWHVVADFLGSASQLMSYWLPHFAAFCVAMIATRVLMVAVYTRTRSVLLMQLMHASSTGSLVMLGPQGLMPAEEVLWFSAYAATVALLAAAVVVATRGRLGG